MPAIVRRMRELGVLATIIGSAIELAPAYIVTRGDLDRAADVVARAVAEVARERGFGLEAGAPLVRELARQHG